MAFTDFTLSMFRGDTQAVVITVTKNSAPVDLTGCDVWMTAKAALTDRQDAAIFSAGTDNGRAVFTNAAGGVVTITLEPTDTASVAAETNAYCDVQIRDTTGAVTTVATGRLTILLDVTQT